jgi:hypothetical protein
MPGIAPITVRKNIKRITWTLKIPSTKAKIEVVRQANKDKYTPEEPATAGFISKAKNIGAKRDPIPIPKAPEANPARNAIIKSLVIIALVHYRSPCMKL